MVLRAAFIDEPDSLNVMQNTITIWESFIFGPLTTRLLKVDNTLYIVPDLAKDMPIVSPDGLTFTFKLKNGKWSDGRPISADDVKFSYEYIKSHDLPNYKEKMKFLKSNEASDDETVVITLSEPYASAYVKLFTSAILPPQVFEGLEGPVSFEPTTPQDLTSGGPFEFKEWKREKYIQTHRKREWLLRSSSIFG